MLFPRSAQKAAQSTAVATCNFTDADGDGLTEICTLDHLARINTDATSRGGDYELVRNLNFSSQHSYAPGSANWSDKTWRPVNASTAAAGSTVVAHAAGQNAGWTPIGPDASSRFSGSFNGRGYRIDNLYVRRTIAGLFEYIASGGVVRNVHVHGNIYGTAAPDITGNIAGYNFGLIIASSSSGTLDGLADGNDYAGGLVGQNEGGTIAASYSTASVDGGATTFDYAGGLTGRNNGTIASSYATGTADGGAGASDRVGGLTGRNFTGATIIASYATGAVSNAGSTGGSVFGDNFGTVTESYGYGAVGGSGGTPKRGKSINRRCHSRRQHQRRLIMEDKRLGFWHQQPVPTLKVGNGVCCRHLHL